MSICRPAISQIARIYRAQDSSFSGGLPGLKAIGVALESRKLVQVSMNLTDFEQTPLDVALGAVRREAAARGIAISGVQYIGLVPKRAVDDAASREAEWASFDPQLILESHLAR